MRPCAPALIASATPARRPCFGSSLTAAITPHHCFLRLSGSLTSLREDSSSSTKSSFQKRKDDYRRPPLLSVAGSHRLAAVTSAASPVVLVSTRSLVASAHCAPARLHSQPKSSPRSAVRSLHRLRPRVLFWGLAALSPHRFQIGLQRLARVRRRRADAAPTPPSCEPREPSL